jgi:LuxR family maltose regulon positive regulatory protein
MDQPCAAAAALVRERGWPSSPWLAAAQTLQAFRALQLTETQRALWSVAAADRAHSALLPAGMALLLRAVEAAARSDTGDAVAAAVALRRARHTLALDAVPRIVVGLAAVVEHELALRARAGGGAVRDLLASVEDRLDGTAELALLQARSLVGAPADDEVIRRLAPIRNGAAAALLPSTAVDAELTCAALAIRAGDRTVARGAVEKALERAADIELVRPFARAGHGVRALLVEQAGSFGPYDEFVGRALVATKADADDRGATPLTVRERSVLARLPLPRSLDEVARDLGVSANTVKTHVRAIYTKFGVTSRRQAVMVARSRGLL